jgi:hypothetical protein
MRFLATLLPLLLTGCGFDAVTGSGNLVTKDIPVAEFQKIDAGGSFTVDVTQGDKPSVTLTADDNLWDRLTVEVRDNTLHLATKPGSYRNVHVEAKVITPKLTALTLSGASRGAVHGIDQKSDSLNVELSGASHVEGDVHAGDLTLGLSGASHATLTGSADVVHIDASGASHASLEKLTGNTAHASLSGASDVQVNAIKNLDYDLSGASHLTYAGSPTVDRAHTSGASDAHSVK